MIFAEYALDTADACHALGPRSVAVTAGCMHATPRREFYAKMDAANVDLMGFTESFSFQQAGAHLAPVLDTLQHVRHETDCWFELTTLLTPGHNATAAPDASAGCPSAAPRAQGLGSRSSARP